ncbi:MAG: helix-turn-helix transcriptional regulator [Bacteroidia bacterium]
MRNNFEPIRGIHPGLMLERELKKRNLPKGRFALSIQEFPQTITSISKGKRRMNTELALKIEQALGYEEGTFMILQVYYDIAQLKSKNAKAHPLALQLRPVLFWDTDIKKIDWDKQKTAVIKRVFERGNDAEKQLIIDYYGVALVNEIRRNGDN